MGHPLEEGISALLFVGNGADHNNYQDWLNRQKLQGAAFHGWGGRADECAVVLLKDSQTLDGLYNGFSNTRAAFCGFTARRKKNDIWEWYCEDGRWHELSADMPEKKLFSEKDPFDLSGKEDTVTILLDAQWEDGSGHRADCGYPMFSNSLMAHSFGGLDGKTYHNTIPAFMNGIQNGYKYFEVDLSYTADERLVLCHGWSEANCKWTGIPYSPDFKDMTYKRIMGMKVHGNPIIDAREFYEYLKKYPQYTFEIDLHNYSGEAVRKRIAAMLKDFRRDQEVLDRLLIQAYSKDMYEDIDQVYHFKYYQYLVGKNIHKLDEIISYSLDHGICALALRANLAKPGLVRKIRNAGIYVLCYTVNKDLQVAKKLLDSGVSTLCTDFITEKQIKEQKESFGHYPFYVYYNSGNTNAVSDYEKIGGEKTAAEKLTSGNLEYKDQTIWNNDGKTSLVPCHYSVKGKTFAGWKLRIRADGKQLWYCKDHMYHGKGDFEAGTMVEPYIFADQEVIPQWTLPANAILVMVAKWK